MEDSALPFLQEPPTQGRDSRASTAPTDPEAVARAAAAMAQQVDRRLAREQPDPARRPVRTAAPDPALAGSVPLPFYSPLHDPARITGARTREVKAYRPRVVECVACEYAKLENRLGDPARHGLDRARLSRGELAHFGPGERDYTVCQTCHDANGLIPRPLYARWVAGRRREDVQRSFRHDPRFEELADRVTEVERWRRGAGDVDLSADLPDGRAQDAADAAGLAPDRDRDFDGIAVDERVPTLADFTAQTPGEGRSRFGRPDPEFAVGAPYDPAVIGSAETEAWMDHEGWEARRKENFRRAWERTGEIEDPDLRRHARAQLVERWDPRMALAGDDRMAMANPFAEERARITPYSRSAAHSGVDEGLAGEPAWRRSALARHEAAVETFLAEVRRKLALQRVPQERIAELTTLPDLNPGREVGRHVHGAPLHERIDPPRRLVVDRDRLPGDRTPTYTDILGALVPAARPTFLAPAAALEEVAREAALRRSVADDVNLIGVLEAARVGDADGFLRMAGTVRQRDAFQAEVRAADTERDLVQRWSAALRQADVEVRAATQGFAGEIRTAFRDPQAFQQAFSALPDAEKRAALHTLRERPADFAREFATAHGRDLGSAGELAATGRGAARQAAMERAGILTANAGERYLDAVRGRDITRVHAARALDLPETARLKEVREACGTRMEAATQRKATALLACDSLGEVPTARELERAFTGLPQADRRRVMQEVPGLTTLLPPAPTLARRAPSL